MTKWRLLDYPHCAVCGNSEQYNDDTFICCLVDNKKPLEYSECNSLETSDEYVVGYLTLLTKIIAKLKVDLDGERMMINQHADHIKKLEAVSK